MADEPKGTPAPGTPEGEHTPESDATLSDEQLGELNSYDENIGKTVQSALAQKVHYREKYGKAEERAVAAETKLAALEKEKAGGQKKSEGETKAEYEQRLARLEFSVKHPGVPDEVLEEVEAYAKVKGISISDAYKSPLMTAFMKQRAADEEAAAATPGPSGRTGNSPSQYKLEDLEDPKKLAAMPQKEFERLSNEAGAGSTFTRSHKS